MKERKEEKRSLFRATLYGPFLVCNGCKYPHRERDRGIDDGGGAEWKLKVPGEFETLCELMAHDVSISLSIEDGWMDWFQGRQVRHVTWRAAISFLRSDTSSFVYIHNIESFPKRMAFIFSCTFGSRQYLYGDVSFVATEYE